MNTLIVSPLLIPLATLVATLLARRSPRAVTALSLAGALTLTVAVTAGARLLSVYRNWTVPGWRHQ